MSDSSRYFLNDKKEMLQVDAYAELLESLTRINLHNPPVQTCSTGWTFYGLYSGPTSIAYLFCRLSFLYPELIFKGQSLLDWATAYLEVGATVPRGTVDANHCGIANETLAQLSLRATIEHDASLAQQLCKYSEIINSGREDGSDEWLYRRAGYLYFLRLVRKEFVQEAAVSSLIATAIGLTISRILASPQPWTWRGKVFLGAAHGSIGIITQIILSSPSTAPQLQDLLSQVLDQQLPSGNLPSTVPASSDRLVQFCHGGPGFILSLTSLLPFFPSLTQKITSAIAAAQNDVWDRGLLTKTPCLCHGIAGNALVLETRERVEHFLAHMSSEMLEENGWLKDAGRSDNFAALFDGEAGRAWAWACADKGLRCMCIGYNDL